MKKMWKKTFAAGLATTLMLGMGATAFAAETKTYTLKDEEGEHKMVVTGVIADTVTGPIEEFASNEVTITISTDSTITYDFPTYGVDVTDKETGERVFDKAFLEENDMTEEEAAYIVTNAKAIPGEEDPIEYEAGYTIQFTKTGEFSLAYMNIRGAACDVLVVVTGDNTTPPAAATITAAPTSSKVLVNGEAVAFDSYNINDNNYFKLRDVAQIISGSDKQFEVTWNGEKRAIELVSGKPYTAVGGEMAKGDGSAKTAVANASAIYKDGAAVELTAYTINDNNYFKLRDLGQAFDFNVSWDGANNCIVINTAESYTAD